MYGPFRKSGDHGGHFARSFTLSNKIDRQQIGAKLEDGILFIHNLDRFLSLDEEKQLESSLGEIASRISATGAGDPKTSHCSIS